MSKTKTDMTFGDLIAEFQDSMEFRLLKPGTQRTYTHFIGGMSDLRNMKVASMTRGDLHKIWDRYADRPASQQTMMKVTRRIFLWGQERDRIPSAPLIRIKRAGKSSGWLPWTDAEIARFREAAKHYAGIDGSRQFVLDGFDIALVTGQRIGDICQMPIAGYDGQGYEFRQAKTGQFVRFDPTGRFRDVLEASKAAGSRYVLNIPPPYHGREARFRYHFDAVRNAADVSKVFHGLRKTVAVRLREEGATDAQIMAILGHADTRMTQAYAKLADRDRLATEAATMLARLNLNGEK